jgi:hypothetical protein
MAEAVCSKPVTGGRRISWENNCLGSGQRVVSKKSSSETTLDARGFRLFLYIWDFARGWYFLFFFCVQFTLRSASEST